MKPQDYAILKEDNDHFMVQHKDGSPAFKVAKQILPKGFDEKIRQYCSGGMAGYADGGEVLDVEEPVLDTEAVPVSQPSLVQSIGDFFQGPNRQVEQAITPEGQAALGAAQQQMFPQTASPAPMAAPVEAAVPEVIPAAQQESLVPVVEPVAPKAPNAFDKAFEAEKTGITAQAEAVGNEGKELAKLSQKSVDDTTKLMEDFKAKRVAQDEIFDKMKQDIESNKIDPNRLWHNMSTGQQVGSVISILFSGAGAGLAHQENAALHILDKAIDRDIEAQKANAENKRSLYSLNLQRTNSDREATLLTQKQLLDIQQAQANKIAAQFKTPQSAAQAQVLNAQIDMKKALVDRQLEQEELLKGIGQRPFSKDLLAAAPKEIRERAVMLPDGKTVVAANTPEGAKEANEKIRTISPLINTLQELNKFKLGALVPGSPERERAEVLASQAKLQLAAAKGFKRFSPELIKELGHSFDNPTNLIDNLRGNHKTEQLVKTINGELDSTLSNISPAYNSPKAIPGAKRKVF